MKSVVLNDLEKELKRFVFDIDVFYSDLAQMKDTKLKELVINILNYISISGSDSFRSNRPDVVSVLGDDPHLLMGLFAAIYDGRKFLLNGKPRRLFGCRQFLSHVNLTEEAGTKSLTIVFSPLFVAYLTGGVPAVRERLLQEGYVA